METRVIFTLAIEDTNDHELIINEIIHDLFVVIRVKYFFWGIRALEFEA